MTVTGETARGWHPDPADPSLLRWHDGDDWTASSMLADDLRGIPREEPPRMPADGCQVCGARPALRLVLHEHHGLLFVQRFASYRGQWCRDCGLATFRRAQTRTLMFGWWGLLSLVVNTANVVQNLLVRARLARLAQPTGRIRPRLRPRRSVLIGPGMIAIGLVPLFVSVMVLR